MSTEDRDRSGDPGDPGLDEKTDVGPGTGRGATAHTPELGEFDREINVRAIVWTGLGLVIVALAAHVLMWLLLRGFSRFDEKRDVPLSPIEAASPQQDPPEPRLEDNPNSALQALSEDEQRRLDHAEWVDRRQGIVRVPIDVAIDVIVARGISASQPASPSMPSPPQPSSPGGRGGSNTEPSQGQVPLSPSGREGQGSEGQR